ncbi:MAG: hypothetical protein DLM52_01850 [Chthoniobacterales bacterium]|nr:MAG: hypothetical protein DLM52_01850 [Chthoniobacterales bacterium]
MLAPWVAADLVRRARDYTQFRRLRAALPPEFWKGAGPIRHYARMIAHWHKSVALCILSDRFRQERWQRHIRVHGIPPDERPECSARPTIVACLHTGGYVLLRHWLRAHGMVAASLVRARPGIIRRYETGRQKSETEPPYFFHVRDVRAAVRYLGPGRVLVVAIDAQPDSALPRWRWGRLSG